MRNDVLKVKDLTKIFKSWSWRRFKYKHTKAVNNLSFKINEGEIVGILGPNGAGKTTTIQMLLGCLTPTSGQVSYFGQQPGFFNPQIKQKLNFASAYSELPHRMTVWENLDVYARLYSVKNKSKRINELLDVFEIKEFKKRDMLSLSAGQKTRVVLAKSFVNYPRLLLLDEPTASLDPEIAAKVRRFLLKQARQYQVSILFTSHNMKEVEEVCDRIIFLNHGQKIAQDTPKGLAQRIKKVKLNLLVIANKQKASDYLSYKKIKYNWKKDWLTLTVKDEQIPKILYRLSQKEVRYKNLEIIRPNLEDFFLKIARHKGKNES